MACDQIDDMGIVQDPDGNIEVRGVGSIRVTPSMEGTKQVFTVQFVTYTLPNIVAEANPVREVGELVDFTWNLSILPGTDAITARIIDPDDYDISAPVAIVVNDETRNSRGFLQKYHIEVTDQRGGVSERDLGITFVNKVYQGFSYKDGESPGQILSQAEIKAFSSVLASSVVEAFGGVNSYVIPASAVQQYIYWVFEVGTTPIASIELNNLPFPVVVLPGSIAITNDNNGAISTNFVIVRSANKFASQTLQLDLQ